jgi:hypothetical protein
MIAGPDFGAWAAYSRLPGDGFDVVPDLTYVGFRLGCAPSLFGVVPDILKVPLSTWR